MKLWMLLLLHLQLAVCVPLPAPCNVSISSLNLQHTLSFLPGRDSPSSSRFTVEVHSHRKRSWRPVSECSQLLLGQTCNLTRALKDLHGFYHVRVRAFTANQTSSWTLSTQFNPLSDTVWGPPDVSVSGCGSCLLLQVHRVLTGGLKQDLPGTLNLQVTRTRDGAQFSLSLPLQEEVKLSYLEPGVEYCVVASVKTSFNSNSVPSRPRCAFTSTPPSQLDPVYVLMGALCALSLLVAGLVAYGGQLSLPLLRRRLLRATWNVLRRPRPDSAPRPAQPMRSSCTAGGEAGRSEAESEGQ